jgi:CheY-like chemotaxis protein
MSTVLLVDDSKFLRLANEKLLQRAGYTVITAADGEEAIRAAADAHPDVVILDMMLPKVQGPEVLRRLKVDPMTRHIPVVVLSSLSQANENKLVGDGAAAYVEKARLERQEDQLLSILSRLLQQTSGQVAGL